MNQEVVGTKKAMQGAEGWGSSEDVEWSRDLKGRGRETVYVWGESVFQEEGTGSAKALRQGLV